MSKYLTFPHIVFKDRRLLLAALADLGYADVETGEALPLYGYQSDRRPEAAEIVVRRQYLGVASNDLGFARTELGYVPIVSEYDVRALQGGQFLPKLRTFYSERVVEEVRNRLDGTMRRTVEGNVVTVEGRRLRRPMDGVGKPAGHQTCGNTLHRIYGAVESSRPLPLVDVGVGRYRE